MKMYLALIGAFTAGLFISTFATAEGYKDRPSGKEAGNAAYMPGQQQQDIDLITAIRKDIADDDGLSIRAQNITITSEGAGKVMLSGKVKNHAEHDKILQIVKRHAEDGINDRLMIERQ